MEIDAEIKDEAVLAVKNPIVMLNSLDRIENTVEFIAEYLTKIRKSKPKSKRLDLLEFVILCNDYYTIRRYRAKCIECITDAVFIGDKAFDRKVHNGDFVYDTAKMPYKECVIYLMEISAFKKWEIKEDHVFIDVLNCDDYDQCSDLIKERALKNRLTIYITEDVLADYPDYVDKIQQHIYNQFAKKNEPLPKKHCKITKITNIDVK